jgi:hypothetical protein
MLKYYVVFTKKQNTLDVTAYRAINLCLWLHIQSPVDVVTVLVCCVLIVK